MKKESSPEDKSNEIFEDAVNKYTKLLKLDMDDDLLHLTAFGIIENTPECMHNIIMIEFTFMLGFHKGLTEEQIHHVLETS